jgi:predicted Zn finger-like uncharacterized protein
MRVTCPTCGAIYEPTEGLLPSAGGHVQCSACHTRWFFRPARPAEALSEDQILERLETRQPDLRIVTDPEPPAEAAPDAEPPPPPAPDTTPARPAARIDLTGAAAADPASPLRSTARTRSPDRAPDETPLPRVEIDEAAGARPGSRARLGFALALAVVALALAAWHYAEPLAARVPAAAPAVHAYADRIDGLRERVEASLGPLRDRLTGG